MNIKINPEYENLAPPLTKPEFNSLKDSIKLKGLDHAITLNQNDTILDGHNRFRACQELNIEPITQVKKFDSEIEEKLFIIRTNLIRRQLNTFQRVEYALKQKTIYEEIAKARMLSGKRPQLDSDPSQISDKGMIGRVDEIIARDANTSRDTVRKVEAILEKSDIADIEKTRAGKQKINQTYNHVKRKELRMQLLEAASEQEISSVFQIYPELITRETERRIESIPKIDKTIFEQNVCTKKDIISFLLPLEDTAVLTNVYFEVDNSQMKRVGLKIE